MPGKPKGRDFPEEDGAFLGGRQDAFHSELITGSQKINS